MIEKLPRVLVIIPAHNEELSVGAILTRLRNAAPAYDRLVVNDGSTDGTGQVVTDMGEKQLRLVSNLGYGIALQTGMMYALANRYDIVVTIDADGQHQPEEAPYLVETLMNSDSDILIGSRFLSKEFSSPPISRRLGQLLFSYLSRIFVGYLIFDTSSGFKVFRGSACEAITNRTFMDFHIETIVRLSLLGFKIREAPITVSDRIAGQSMYSISSVFEYPLKTILLTIVAAMDVLIERRTQ